MDDHNEPLSRRIHQKPAPSHALKWGLAALVVLGLGAAWWHFYRQPDSLPTAPPSPPESQVQSPEPVVPPPVAAPAPVQQEPEAPPIVAAADSQGNPPLQAQDAQGLAAAVSSWLGNDRTQRFIATDSLAQRVVATVDNLPRKLVASRLWPLHPVGGRMQIHQTDDGGMQIAPENAARYDAVVGFVTGIDAAQAGAFYRRVYPVLQHAYEELGYPGKSFNERLVATIDHLLQTPEPQEPLRLQMVKVQGQLAPQHPWLRYEFADSQLQSLSAGQKILVRMGPVHTQRVKGQLRALRAQITQR